MPTFDILSKCQPSRSYRVARVRSAYDFTAPSIETHLSGEIVFPDDWRIGVITGHSGTGKTTIARHLWAEHCVDQFVYSAPSVIDDFQDHVADEAIFKTLHRVGFGSIPSWLKPYSVLSRGEQMRVDLARAILECPSPVVVDEFTATVDRDVARFACLAARKAIRESDKQFIAVSCHDDFIEWLQPDWVFDTNVMRMKKKTESASIYDWMFESVGGVPGCSLPSIIISVAR